MPKVLTTNAQILCPHGGIGTSIPSDPQPKWFIDNGINNGAVLVENDTGIIKGCILLQVPCSSYVLKSMKLNATEVDGRRVILDTDFNQTNTELPLRIQESHQTFDNSTVAPLPPGQTSQTLPPELIYFVKPIVQAVTLPSPLAFVIATNTPTQAVVTFTLTSDHPLKWTLTLISDTKLKPKHVDLTHGESGLSLVPVGGSWDTPILVVTMTMSNTYMAALPMGTHDFFMTGVSQRGLFGSAKIELTVS
jgi:hypothetical protein